MAQMTRFKGGRDLLSQLHNDFNRLLAPFEFRTDLEWNETEWVPSVDIKEDGKRYMIHMDVPGVKGSDIDISMDNGTLTIKGKRELELKSENNNFLRVERSRGTFLRQLSLPEAVDHQRIEAKCHDGVLEIILPKSTQNTGHKIKVKEI